VAKKTSRPGRTLLIFFIAVAVLYGFAALGGTFKPKLGLDLSGGTEITLTAIDGPGLTADNLKLAASIIDKRVNGSGVAEASVATSGSNQIVVDVPQKNAGDLVAQVSRTAELRFRLVAIQTGAVQKTKPTPTKNPSSTATPTNGATSKSTPTSTPTTTPTSIGTPTKGAAPRPAPFDETSKKVTPTPTPTPTPTATATTPAPSILTGVLPSTKGQTLDQTIAWTASPPAAWTNQFATFSCPKVGDQTIDDPNQPLMTCDASGNRYLLSKAVIEGSSLSSASAGIPPGNLIWAVNLQLNNDNGAITDFTKISQTLLDNRNASRSPAYFAIVLDGQVLQAPYFQSVINNGASQISGSFNEASAKALANSLSFGSLPIHFGTGKADGPRVEIIGPSLAGSQLSAGILAGIIGLIVVMIYCLLYYRGLGLVVISSLLVAGGVTYAMVLVLAKSAGFTLSLPGIAGLIVAVGITADSFIVFFERIRDEMRDGKSMRVAVEAGWVRARNTCLAADSVSLLAAIVLYIFAIGVVRGFAFALGISTLIDLAVFFWFTKPTVTLLAKRTFFNSGHRLSGLSAETLGVDSLAGHAQLNTVGGNA
jgi:preprotein translocase subunit SecD